VRNSFLIIVLGLLLTNCSSIEWAKGPCSIGYKVKDTCYINGEQIKFIENHQFNAQILAEKDGFEYGKGLTLNY
jgi:hypothetical protein